MSDDVNALSMANIAFSATNVVSGGVHCACMSSGCSPMLPWASCPMLAASIPSLLASVATASENADTGTQIDKFDPSTTSGTTAGTTTGAPGGGGGLPTLPTMQWGQFCSKTPEFCNDCAKSGNYSNCKPEMQLPDNVDVSAFNTPELQSALEAFEKAADLVNSAPHENMLADAMGAGSDGDFGFGMEDGAAASDPTYVKKSKGLGREDKSGLDRASMWGMDMVDEKTGAKLTLWQRATRRYYGAPDLNRLNFLARAEYIRSRAINHAKTILKDPEKAAAQAAAFAPASSRAPASIVPSADKSATAIVPVSPK